MPDGISQAFIPADSTLGQPSTVDRQGQPQDVKVTKPISPYWDARVVEAIQKPHFTLGKLDSEPSPIEIDLVVGLTR